MAVLVGLLKMRRLHLGAAGDSVVLVGHQPQHYHHALVVVVEYSQAEIQT